jgi:adenine-specific DNA-methyltransferase
MTSPGIQFQIPAPEKNECPTTYADRIGHWYVSRIPRKRRKELGQYLTPPVVADFMADLCCSSARSLRILDPAAGAGILSCALCEVVTTRNDAPSVIELEAWEVDSGLADCLEQSLRYAADWLKRRGVMLKFNICADDFVMTQAAALDETPGLFPVSRPDEAFDLVIANPPYFKIPKSDSRAHAASAVVHGQPNIYALFMAVSAALLRTGGQAVFITPRSYTAGPYFRLFRERFFARMQPQAIHLFSSRREAFRRDEVLQENIILLARRADGWQAVNGESADTLIDVSLSAGASDLAQSRRRRVALARILNPHSREKVLHIPADDEDDETARLVRSWPGSLHAYGLEISTGPVVPFRATALLAKNGAVPRTHAPLLWMQNVTPMQIAWPTTARNKEQFIVINDDSYRLLLPNRNYVVMRRFNAREDRRRLVAAPLPAGLFDSPFVGLENHLNYVHRPGGALAETEAFGLAALFNSALLDGYFRSFNGNTQVSATELRAMPLPAMELILEIGSRLRAASLSLEEIDALIAEMFQLKKSVLNQELYVDNGLSEEATWKPCAGSTAGRKEAGSFSRQAHLIHFNGDRFLGPRS